MSLPSPLKRWRRGMAVDVVIVLVAGFGAHGIDEAAAAGDELQAGVEEAAVEAVLERLMEIADGPEFFFDVALLRLFCGKALSVFALKCRRLSARRKSFRRRACRS